MSIKERIEEQLSAHDVLLYMKGSPDFPQCGFSGQAVAALNAIGKPYAYVNIFEDPEIREGLKEFSSWPTFPQLYVKGELVGGCDIMVEMFNSGEVPIFLDCGIQPVFMGRVLSGPKMPNLTYMTVYSDEDHLAEAWSKFGPHPDWQKLKEVEKYKGTVSKIHKTLLTPRPYSGF